MLKRHLEKLEALQKEIVKAKQIKRTLGIRSAAGYLRNREWSLEASLFILLGK